MLSPTMKGLSLSAALLSALGAGLLSSAQALAESPQEKGLRIMQESEQRDDGWRDSKADLEMILRKANGREVLRKISSQAMEGKNGHDKSLIEFKEPLDVRGTVFLTHSHPLEPDDQWIFLPALDRTKRISSKRQTGRFMGSEFTYEDLSAFSVQKYEYKYLNEAPCGEPVQDCHVIELTPKNKYSGYSKGIVYIDKEHLRLYKNELYNKKTGKHQKTLTAKSYQQYLGQYWRPDTMLMKNELTGDETELHFKNQEYRTGVRAADFRKSALEGRQ